MTKFNKSLLFQLIFLIAGYFICFQFENYGLIMILMFLPFIISSIILYQKFEKSFKNKNSIILSKSNFDFWTLGFALVIAAYCLSNLDIYTGIIFIMSLIYLFIEYSVSKRRILFIGKDGINELGKDKHREIKEITSLNMYENNVEFRFNKHEILQINQNELIQPQWNDFIKRITEIKNIV